jgi:hypothetical protein
MRERKETWEQKIQIVEASFERARREARFARQFYENLFFLSPKLQDHFQKTDLVSLAECSTFQGCGPVLMNQCER